MLLKSRTYQKSGPRPCQKGWITILTLLIWAGLAADSWSDKIPHRMESLPFAPGERLSFELRWTLIPAGKAVLEVLPMQVIDGAPAYHFRLTVKSNSFVDLIYKVRDRIDSFVNQEITHSVRYIKKQREGDVRREVTVAFDWKAGVAHYTKGKKKRSLELPPGAFDPLSAFYYTRTLALSENDLVERSVTDGRKCITGRARIVKREQVVIENRSYDTFLIEPEMEEIGGVFEKEKGAKIKLWVTADHRHIPVKIASKVSIGSFVGELVRVEPMPMPLGNDLQQSNP